MDAIQRRWRLRMAAAAVVLLTGVGGAAPSVRAAWPSAPATLPAPATRVVQPEWLSVLNAYRTMSGLGPVTMNSSWSDAARNHACYMTLNGMGHDEVPTKPGYTASGDVAAAQSNVAVNTGIGLPQRYWLELWLSGPFHAIGLLRHNLFSAGYGDCENPTTYWKSAAALNVIAGLGTAPRPSTPIVFPGNGATTSIDRFIAETPNPVEMCGWTGEAGLPLIAMFPQAPSGPVTASLSGPSGALQVCPLWSGNMADGWGRDTVRGDNAVVVVPRARLQPGLHTATVRAGTRTVTWSFVVDPTASPLPTAPTASPLGTAGGFTPLTPTRVVDTRLGDAGGWLPPGTIRRIPIAGQAGVVVGATGVAINVTAVAPVANGYLTTYPCTAAPPVVSSINFRAGQTIANLAHVPLAADGSICMIASAGTHLVIDVAGAYGPSGTHALRSLAPLRLLDTRERSTLLEPGTEYSVDTSSNTVAGDAVEVSVVATGAVASGYLTMWPCGQPRPTVSNLNYEAGGVRSNHALVVVGVGGLCVSASTAVHVVVDLNGVMASTSNAQFTATAPFRLVDTRSVQLEALQAGFGGGAVPAGATMQLAVAGDRGIPPGVSALVVNLTVVGATGTGWVTVWPCGTAGTSSTMNYDASAARASAAVLTVSATGTTCLLTSRTAHVLIDVVGWWD